MIDFMDLKTASTASTTELQTFRKETEQYYDVKCGYLLEYI